MKQISSRLTWFVKKVFPAFWFGFLLVFLSISVFANVPRDARVPFVIVPCVMAVFGFLLFRKLIWDLADEVFDAGDHLVVRKGGEQDVIRLDNIMNVSATVAVNPPRITLRLVKPGRFGDEVVFSPPRPFSLNPFARNAVAEDLIVRVDAARRGLRR
jgi:hypothetical protein